MENQSAVCDKREREREESGRNEAKYILAKVWQKDVDMWWPSYLKGRYEALEPEIRAL